MQACLCLSEHRSLLFTRFLKTDCLEKTCEEKLVYDLDGPVFFSRLIYYLDPSVLTGLSCSVMLLCLADYLVPTLAPRVFGSNKW